MRKLGHGREKAHCYCQGEEQGKIVWRHAAVIAGDPRINLKL